jgi:hypothetical protein
MGITNAFLDAKVKLLNTVTGSPVASYTTTKDGIKANVGNFLVENVCGHYNLARIVSEGGGQESLTSGTRADIVLFITAYLAGYQAAKETKS